MDFMVYLGRFQGSERVCYVTRFVILESLLGGQLGGAKLYVGCVSKIGETRVCLGLCRDWSRKGKQNKTEKRASLGLVFLVGSSGGSGPIPKEKRK